MYSLDNIILDVIQNEEVLDVVNRDLLEEFHAYLGFYLLDRNLEELNFDEGE